MLGSVTGRGWTIKIGSCSVPNCLNKYLARRLCSKHWQQWKKTGWPPAAPPLVETRTPEVRFWEKVDVTSSCWLWTGALVDGYGVFHPGGGRKMMYAYHFLVGRAP